MTAGNTRRSFHLTIAVASLLVSMATSQNIFEPPSLTEPVRANDKYFNTGGNVTLDCKARGIPAPSYEWYYKDKPIEDETHKPANQRIYTVDKTTGRLNITGTTSREEGTYVCKASNNMGGVKAVSVSPPQEVRMISLNAFDKSKHEYNEEATAYGPVTLACRGQGEIVAPPGSTTYKWYFGEKSNQLNDDNGRIITDSKGGLHFVYTLQSDDSSVKGIYRCGISGNELDRIDLGSVYLLDIRKSDPSALKPALMHSNSGLRVRLQSTAKLECIFSGYQPSGESKLPTITWYDDADNEIRDNGRYKLSKLNRVLTIQGVTLADERTYKCQAKTSAGYSSKELVSLNVTSLPFFKEAPHSDTVTQGSDVPIKCHAFSLDNEMPPSPPVWTVNGVEFALVTKKNLVLSDDKKTLTINNVQKPDDIMCVNCVVENSVGQTMGSACINVIIPIKIQTVCDKCEGKSADDECNCETWDIAKGDTIQLRVSATADPAYETRLRREWIVGNAAYRSPQLPPHLTFDTATGNYQLNTSTLTDEQFASLGSTYVLKVYHPYDAVNLTLTVSLIGVTPAPSAASAGFDMWIIGLIVGIIFLIIIVVIIIFCVCRKKEEGVYNLGKKETDAGYNAKVELEQKTFSDLARPEQDDMTDYADFPEDDDDVEKTSREILFREHPQEDRYHDDSVFDVEA